MGSNPTQVTFVFFTQTLGKHQVYSASYIHVRRCKNLLVNIDMFGQNFYLHIQNVLIKSLNIFDIWNKNTWTVKVYYFFVFLYSPPYPLSVAQLTKMY